MVPLFMARLKSGKLFLVEPGRNGFRADCISSESRVVGAPHVQCEGAHRAVLGVPISSCTGLFCGTTRSQGDAPSRGESPMLGATTCFEILRSSRLSSSTPGKRLSDYLTRSVCARLLVYSCDLRAVATPRTRKARISLANQRFKGSFSFGPPRANTPCITQ